MKKWLKNEKFFTFIIGLWGIVMILPLLVLSFFNVMSADDYAVGKGLRVIDKTPEIGDAFVYAWEHVKTFHFNWRGCYTINFLDCFNPGFFGEQYAFLTPIVMLVILLASTYCFIRAIMKHFLQADRRSIFVVWVIFCFLQLQTMPAMVETIFWYSGGTCYTVAQGVFFLFFAILFSGEDCENKSKKIVYGIGVCVLAFLVGGCQYTIVLEALIWFVFYMLYQFIFEKKIPNLSVKVAGFLTLFTGAMLNLTAPGNLVRRRNSGNGMGALEAIIQSFMWAIRRITEWMSPMFFAVILLAILVIWNIQSRSEKKNRYPYPILMLLFSFCVVASCFTASLYGVGGASAGRIQNQVQGFFYLIVFFDIFYVVGFIQRKARESEVGLYADLIKVAEILSKYRLVFQWLVLALVCLIWIGTGDKNTFNSISATRSLLNGEAVQYYAENKSRLKLYQNSDLQMVEIEAFSVKPKLLYFDDLVGNEEDINYWINESIAAYYGKEKVLLTE